MFHVGHTVFSLSIKGKYCVWGTRFFPLVLRENIVNGVHSFFP